MRHGRKKADNTERDSIFLGWKNQYCANDGPTKCNLQISAIPVKLPMAYFTELEPRNLTIHMERQKTPK